MQVSEKQKSADQFTLLPYLLMEELRGRNHSALLFPRSELGPVPATKIEIEYRAERRRRQRALGGGCR